MHYLIALVWGIWSLIGLYSHVTKHWGEEELTLLKNKTYREDGTLESMYKHRFLGYGSRYHYRKDGSLWKKEDFFFKEPLKESLTLYYPSGRIKYTKS